MHGAGDLDTHCVELRVEAGLLQNPVGVRVIVGCRVGEFPANRAAEEQVFPDGCFVVVPVGIEGFDVSGHAAFLEFVAHLAARLQDRIGKLRKFLRIHDGQQA